MPRSTTRVPRELAVDVAHRRAAIEKETRQRFTQMTNANANKTTGTTSTHVGGPEVNTTREEMSLAGTGPNVLESCELSRWSPMRKTEPAGTVVLGTGIRKVFEPDGK